MFVVQYATWARVSKFTRQWCPQKDLIFHRTPGAIMTSLLRQTTLRCRCDAIMTLLLRCTATVMFFLGVVTGYTDIEMRKRKCLFRWNSENDTHRHLRKKLSLNYFPIDKCLENDAFSRILLKLICITYLKTTTQLHPLYKKNGHILQI